MTSFADQTFGIEIECNVSSGMRALEDALIHAGIWHTWKVVHDGSLNAGVGGMELVTRSYLTGATAKRELRAVCAVLASIGATVDECCGLHVHVGVSGFSTKQIAAIAATYVRYEQEFDTLMFEGRRCSRSTFCKSLTPMVYHYGSRYNLKDEQARVLDALSKARTIEAVATVINGGVEFGYHYTSYRYHKVNLQAFSRLGTIEFRQHHGTVAFEDIWGWVNFIGHMVVSAAKKPSFRASALPSDSLRFAELTKLAPSPARAWAFARRAVNIGPKFAGRVV